MQLQPELSQSQSFNTPLAAQTPSHAVAGFDVAGIAAGIKKNGNADLALIASAIPCRAAAVFTQNAFPAAPVIYDRVLLNFNPESIHAVIINAGCANACTGVQGDVNTRITAEQTAQALGVHDHSVFVMSTGVIGVQLPMERLLPAIPRLVDALGANNWPAAAAAIMTTDTRPKLVSRSVEIGGRTVRLSGIAKGAGMIHPDMATMLSVVVSDVAMSQPLLQKVLVAAANRSFNRISIDGDTSTNDTVILLANGAAGNEEIADEQSQEFLAFQHVVTDLCAELAQAIVRDGEGATRFVTIQINGAASDADAHSAANTVATSPLVKTALFGGDANWGRILAAVGRAGIQVDPGCAALFINGGKDSHQRMGELQLVQAGQPLNYSEAEATAIFAQAEIDLRVELGLGNGSATVWTCDLSHDYVSINGDYRS
jgi:glutamate N-acetyltransferase/amino-acid N-acetyltransferase